MDITAKFLNSKKHDVFNRIKRHYEPFLADKLIRQINRGNISLERVKSVLDNAGKY